MHVVEINNLCKSFRVAKNEHFWNFFNREYEDTLVLDKINLKANKGECIGFLGRNGSGKSTLLKIVSGVMEPSEGEVILRGSILPMLEIGTGFNPELDAIQNIKLYSALLGLNASLSDEQIDEILDFAEVASSKYKPLKFFSSGMYMRLAFSVASFQIPEVIILDEVLAVGDPSFQKKCLKRMTEMKINSTLLFVSHNMLQISQICDKCVILENGKVDSYFEDVFEGINYYEEKILKIQPANYKPNFKK